MVHHSKDSRGQHLENGEAGGQIRSRGNKQFEVKFDNNTSFGKQVWCHRYKTENTTNTMLYF